MRIKVNLLLSLLLITLMVVVMGIDIKDVKPSSDIYEHVVKVIEAGIMKVDDKGYFNGSLLVTRYDMAEVLSKLLDKVSIEAISKITQQMESLQKLPDELGKANQRITLIENQLSQMNFEELVRKIGELKVELSAQIDTLESNLEYVKGYNSFVEAINESISKYVSQVDEQQFRLTASEKNLSQLSDILNKLNDDMDYVFKEIESINGKMLLLDDLRNNFESSDKLKKTFEASMTSLENSLQRIKENLREYDAKIDGIMSRTETIRDLNEEISSINEEFSNVKRLIVTTNDSLTLIASDVETLKTENENLKLENQNLKKEVATLKRGIWYSVIAGIAGVSLGTLALILVWQSGTGGQ